MEQDFFLVNEATIMNENIQILIRILTQFQAELEHQQTNGYEISAVKLRDKVSIISQKVESIILEQNKKKPS